MTKDLKQFAATAGTRVAVADYGRERQGVVIHATPNGIVFVQLDGDAGSSKRA